MKKKRFATTTLAVTLALGVILPTLDTYTITEAHASTQLAQNPISYSVAEASYTKEQQEGLAYINDLRKKMGLQPVKLNQYLTKAAQNHANYLVINKATGHEEIKGKKGFTGERSWDRIGALTSSFNEEHTLSEGVTYIKSNITDALKDLIDGPLHRLNLVNPNLTDIGFSRVGTVTVVNYAKYSSTVNKEESMYPYDGQKDVPLEFIGASENPNPIKDFGIDKTGYAITFSPQGDVFLPFDTGATATMKDDKGNNVSLFHTPYGEQLYFPKNPLKPNTKYTITVKWVDDITGEKGSRTWSFTTIKSTTSTTPPPANTCKPAKGKVMWKGYELKKGQLGLVTILKNTPLYTLKNNKEVFSRTLKKGEVYRIYSFKGTERLDLGAGYYVDRDNRIKYETPSKEKLAQVNCK